jgi:hypothetical protein
MMRFLCFVCFGCVLISLDTPASAQNKNDKKKASPAAAKESETDPLKALGAAVDLPPMSPAGKWSTLAKTTIPDKLIVLFSLRGGDRCLGKGKKVEAKERADGRSWQCLATLKEGMEPVEIGVFRIEKQNLQFSWSEGAADFPGAALLRNAAFEIAVGTSKKLVGLRKPIKGDPLPISYDEPTSVFLEIPDAPVLSTVRIEVDMPTPEYMSRRVNWRLLGDGPALKASDDRMWAESIRLGHFAVKLETSAGKFIKVTATPMFWVADREKPQRLSAKGLATALAQVEAYQKQLTTARDQISGKKGATDAQKAQRDAMTKELALVRKTASDLEALQDFIKSNKLGNIHLKVSHEMEPGYMAPLLTTK